MKRTIFLKAMFLSMLLVLTLCPLAIGGQIQINRIDGYYDPSYGGGEMNVNVTNKADGLGGVLFLYLGTKAYYDENSFETFCLERNEFFSPGITYNASWSAGAQDGGYAGGNPDPISKGTAWLYSHFAANDLAGYSYDASHIAGQISPRAASARVLQETIWYLEGEMTSLTDHSFLEQMKLRTGLTTDDQAKEDNNGLYLAGALNVTMVGGGTAQDQMVLVPGASNTNVPEPATLFLFGTGLLGIAAFRGRFKRS